MRLHLELIDAQGRCRGRPFALPPGGTLVIGREPLPGVPLPDGPPDIAVPDLHVGRRHCEIRVEGAGVWVRDLRSWSGFLINGARYGGDEWVALQPDEVLRLGATRLRLAATVPVEREWLLWNGGLVPRLAQRIQEE